MRGMISTYVLVIGGLIAGVYVGAFVLHYNPPFVGWIFGAGAGVSLGAFIAAIATNTPLVGSANQRTHRGVIHRDENDDLEGDTPSSSGNGAGPAH
ncbi:MAG: hypothetical protein WCL53_01240 [Chloroflexota bacterium]